MRPRMPTAGMISRVNALTLLLVIIIATGGLAAKQTDKTLLPVAALQLPPDQGTIPVELKCGNAELAAPNEIDKISCVIRNNTKKPISAAAVLISLTVEQAGRLTLDTSYLTVDASVHPDMRAERDKSLIWPGRESTIRDTATAYESDVLIKRVRAQIDYVEFDDHTALGPNKAGSRVLADTRAGAARYKDWLQKKFRESDKSRDAIASILETEPSPEELGLENDYQQHGVYFYQDFAKKLHKTKGAEGVLKLLGQTNSSVKK